MRKTKFVTKEYYHIYNRGVDKRDIFMDPQDINRFLEAMTVFNVEEPVGSLYENSFRQEKNKKLGSPAPKLRKLVNFVAYCLNQNHYHFILEPLVENGIQKFMHKLSTSYTNYFNERYERSGSLFQGKYQAVHINSNEYLLYLSVYVNLNYRVHKGLNKEWMKKLPISSFSEYSGEATKIFCVKDIVLGQFKNLKDYVQECEVTFPEILRRKEEDKEFKYLLLE